MPIPDSAPFFELIERSLRDDSFLKATLSRPWREAPAGLRNVFLRPVELRGERMVSWTFRHERRDEVKNLTAAETLTALRERCGPWFRNTDAFTATREATLTHNRRGEPAVFIREASSAAPAAAGSGRHDREKSRLLDPGSLWLRELGITGSRGEVLPASQAKWRQINRFLEIVAGLIRGTSLPADAAIADMGCGKGYLTFALYEFLTVSGLVPAPQVTGVELRPELVTLCQATAGRAGFAGLRFVQGSIASWQPPRLDMLIALHACDTATDEAIAAGIRSGAEIIVTAPCCHHQLRQTLTPPPELVPLLRHGILAERQADLLTDGMRALLLESQGYRTSVFEFISTEHTARNLMIAAVRTGDHDPAALTKLENLRRVFGAGRHHLETLLANDAAR